jgi:hypothetical protein
MPARRIALALLLAGTAAAAQERPFYPPSRDLPLEQVQKAIAKLKGEAPSGLDAQFREMALRMFPQLKSDPAKLDEAIRGITGDPDTMRQLREIARKQKETGKLPTPADLAPLVKNIPNLPVPKAGSSPRPGAQPTPGPVPPPQPPSAQPPPAPPKHDTSQGDHGLGGGAKGQDVPHDQPKVGWPGGSPGMGEGARQHHPGGPHSDEHRHRSDLSPWKGGFHPPPQPDFEKVMQREKAYRALAGYWEQTLGPVNGTPAVQQFLREMVTAGEGITDADGNSVWAGLAADPGDGSGLADWFQKTTQTGGWQWPALDLPSFDRGTDAAGPSKWSLPSLPERNWSLNTPSPSWPPSRGWFGGDGGDGPSWWPVVVVGLVLAGTAGWWFLRRWSAAAGGPVPLPGLGPWPIDPRHIADRGGVVRAFEYLGVLRCGPGAKAWNHAVISAALGDLAADPDTARGLGRVYELARYTPDAEPLAPHDLDSARRFLCRLAGVPAP